MTLARDGLREIAIAGATVGLGGVGAAWAALTVSPWWWVAAVPLLVVFAFVLAFFRDPDRTIPSESGLVVSGADGTVTEITRLDQYEGIDGPAVRIGVFLSLFDVHINRSPCAARVVQCDYQPGEFLDARHPECGQRNEAMTIRLEPTQPGARGPIIVRQIAGLVARRIICRVGPGDLLERGQRFGMIKFGSRTEVIMPDGPEVKVAVQLGDKVRGGSTILVRVGAVEHEGGAGPSADRRAEQKQVAATD